MHYTSATLGRDLHNVQTLSGRQLSVCIFMTCKHFINELYRQSFPEGTCSKKQDLWLGLGALLFVCASCTMNYCKKWALILQGWEQKYKLCALFLTIRQCCLVAGSSSLPFTTQETESWRWNTIYCLEGILLFKLLGLSSLSLSSVCLTNVSQSFETSFSCYLPFSTKVRWGCVLSDQERLLFWWMGSRGREIFLALDADESKDMSEFHILCLQGCHKSWAVKHFSPLALTCVTGLCTHSSDPQNQAISVLWVIAACVYVYTLQTVFWFSILCSHI